MNITVKYSCADCGLERVSCDVPARGEEDVIVWMEATASLASKDHNRRSPLCRPTTLTELMIPMSGTDRVGGPAIQ